MWGRRKRVAANAKGFDDHNKDVECGFRRVTRSMWMFFKTFHLLFVC